MTPRAAPVGVPSPELLPGSGWGSEKARTSGEGTAVSAAVELPRTSRTVGGSAALVTSWVACLLLLGLTLPLGRPVNDDYWALGSLNDLGFLDSLTWYYLNYQGNVVSWFFILLHEVPWWDGIRVWGAAPSLLVVYGVLAGACWGALRFLGVRLPNGWRRWAVLTIVTTVVWLSLASVVSPNTMTLVFYVPSTIVHVWPWCFFLIALGIVSRGSRLPLAWLWMLFLGLLAASLGLVEAVLVSASSLIVAWAMRRKRSTLSISPLAVGAWFAGLGAGLLVQLVSPATWGRGSGIGSEGALSTNVQAVERVLAQGDALMGSAFSQGLLNVAALEVWARALVPVAVIGDLLLRPGLVAIFVMAAWWSLRDPGAFTFSGSQLRPRLVGLALVTLTGAVAYSLSGALYAYAGRHVAGLAIVVSVLMAGLGVYWRNWWSNRSRLLRAAAVLSAVTLVALGVQQAWFGITRAVAWDDALALNRALIQEGRLSELMNVPLKAGVSQSGLRDHDGSPSYVEWVQQQE